MGRKAGVSIRSTVYGRFKGADFSTDPSLVAKSRSPLCTNIVADEGGMPEKRCGWRSLHRFGTAASPERINGIHRGVFGGAEKILVHAKTKLYLWDGTTATQLLTGLNDGKSRSAYMAGKLWILTGAEFLCYDGATAWKVTEGECYVPTILVTRMPEGGGDTLEEVNMATPKRREQFQADGVTRKFTVSSTRDAGSAVRAWVYDTDSGEWREKILGTDFSVSGQNVTFVTAPPAPAAGSADMVRIEYSHTVAGYADRINRCSIMGSWGINGTNKLCISGNPDFPNYDWTCGLNDPTYWPDMRYAVIGSEKTAVMGYLRLGSTLAVVKEDDGQESSVYFRSGSVDEAGETTYLTPALAGVGAISRGSFASLLDDQLFLAETGILSVNEVSGTRATQNRSFYVDPKMHMEAERDQAESIAWRGMLLTAFPSGHCYVLDARQEKGYRREANSDFVYECYYWENIPARCWMRAGDRLWFGTADGRLCRFMSDDVTVNRFEDDGEPIRAVWATCYDDDGTPGQLKTMIKPGACVTIKPMTRSSAVVLVRTDRTAGVEVEANRETMDIFSWEDIDFERFTFESDESPQEIFLRKKVKNYKRMQIVVRNEELHEGFGVYQITKNYVVGNFAKR